MSSFMAEKIDIEGNMSLKLADAWYHNDKIISDCHLGCEFWHMLSLNIYILGRLL